MSFDAEYPNRKDRRKPYRTTGRFDRSCRPGGDCPWCEGNRLHADAKRRLSADEQLADVFGNPRFVDTSAGPVHDTNMFSEDGCSAT